MGKYKSKEWLYQRYVEEGHTIDDIATEVGVTDSTIHYWLSKFDITDKYVSDVVYNSKDWLEEKYLGYGLTQEEISKLPKCDVGEAAIAQRLSYFNLKVDDIEQSKRLSTSHGTNSESKHLDPVWLREQYIEKSKTDREIASMDCVDASRSSVGRIRRSFGIDSEYHNPSDETSPKYYGKNWDKIASRIRKRDSYRCQRCSITQREYMQKFDIKLDVHHKIPFNNFDDPIKAHKDDNLITLCRSCHKEIENSN